MPGPIHNKLVMQKFNGTNERREKKKLMNTTDAHAQTGNWI